MKLVEKIRTLIDLRGFTQDGFEAMAGLPHGRISKWASGKGEPTVSQAQHMARLLQVDFLELLDDESTGLDNTTSLGRQADIWKAVQTLGFEESWRRLLDANQYKNPGERGPGQRKTSEFGEISPVEPVEPDSVPPVKRKRSS